jgi:hypothetical protein
LIREENEGENIESAASSKAFEKTLFLSSVYSFEPNYEKGVKEKSCRRAADDDGD